VQIAGAVFARRRGVHDDRLQTSGCATNTAPLRRRGALQRCTPTCSETACYDRVMAISAG